MIGYGTFVPRKGANTHLYGPASSGLPVTIQVALCGGPKWANKVNNAWADLYHDHATPQEAAQASVRPVTCPGCLEYV